MPRFKNDARSNEWVWLAVILVAGLALRLYRLGALGLAWNEDYLAITVRSILADGRPDFPSGLLYVRALPLSYLTAGLVRLVGWSEVALRLPSVLFSTLSIAGVYLLGRRWMSPRVALLAALLMAVSNWEVEVGRTARMYAMFSASCLMSLVFLQRALERRSRWAGLAAAGCGALAAFTHQIGLALAIMVACFFLYPKPDRWRAGLLTCLIAVVSLSAIVNSRIASSQYGDWGDVVGAVSREAPVSSDRTSPPEPGAAERFSSRFLSPFLTLQQTHREVFLASMALAGSIVLLPALALAWRARDGLFALASAALVVSLCLQQLMVAAMVVVAYLLVDRVRESSTSRRRPLLLGLVFLAASAGWLLYWLLAGPAMATVAEAGLLPAAKQLLKPLIGYPPSFLREFYLQRYPLMSALASAACLVAAVRFWRTRRVDALGLCVLLFVVPATALGFHPEALERFQDRYVFFVDPYFLLLVAFAAVWIGERLRDALPVRRSVRVAAVGLYTLALLAASGLANARASLALVTAGYGAEEAGFQPDLAGPAQFVCAHSEPADVVIAMDILGHYAYCPVAHYQLSLYGKPDAEAWIGGHSLATAEALAEALEHHRGQRVWIVLAATHLTRFGHDPEMKAILRLIVERAGEPRYRGRDGLSHVYLVGPWASGGDRHTARRGNPGADQELTPRPAARAGVP